MSFEATSTTNFCAESYAGEATKMGIAGLVGTLEPNLEQIE